MPKGKPKRRIMPMYGDVAIIKAQFSDDGNTFVGFIIMCRYCGMNLPAVKPMEVGHFVLAIARHADTGHTAQMYNASGRPRI